MLLIKNGRVLNPSTKSDSMMDVLLDGDRIKEVAAPGKTSAGAATSTSQNGLEVFDASGLIVAPGFIDIHVHLREPGQENSETIETGTRSAAKGGFTAVCCMPNTKPVWPRTRNTVSEDPTTPAASPISSKSRTFWMLALIRATPSRSSKS